MKINELKTKLEKELKDDWFDNVYIEASDLKIKCKDANKNKIVYNIKFDEDGVEYENSYVRSEDDLEHNIRNDIKDIANWVKKLPTSKEYSNIISKGECKINRIYVDESDSKRAWDYDDEDEDEDYLVADILIDVDVIFTLKQGVVDDAHLLKLIKTHDADTLDSIIKEMCNVIKSSSFTVGGYTFKYINVKTNSFYDRGGFCVSIEFDTSTPTAYKKMSQDEVDEWWDKYEEEYYGVYNNKGTNILAKQLKRFDTKLKKLGYCIAYEEVFVAASGPAKYEFGCDIVPTRLRGY